MRRFSVRRMVAVFAVASAMISTAEAARVHRSIFYENTPFGSLAWVRGSPTRASAKTKLAIDDLTGESCINLPASGAQWFMVNHRDEEMEGQTGYFSVRILYQFDKDHPEDSRTGIHLQRNGNWFDAKGKQIARDYERNPEQIALSGKDFISLHDPVKGKESVSLAALEDAVGPWHMKPTEQDEITWVDRHLQGAQLKAYLGATTEALSARFIRFTATSGSSSGEPVLFWLDPRGATSALILVDAPRHTSAGSRRVYSVLFGGTCP